MLSPKEIARLKERLVRERDRVFNIHARLREDREDLVAPEVEFEENAQEDEQGPSLLLRRMAIPGLAAGTLGGAQSSLFDEHYKDLAAGVPGPQ